METLTPKNARDGMTIQKRFDISTPKRLFWIKELGVWMRRVGNTWEHIDEAVMNAWEIVTEAPLSPHVALSPDSTDKLGIIDPDATSVDLKALSAMCYEGREYFGKVRDGRLTPGLVAAMAAEGAIRLTKIQTIIDNITGPSEYTQQLITYVDGVRERLETIKEHENLTVDGQRLLEQSLMLQYELRGTIDPECEISGKENDDEK